MAEATGRKDILTYTANTQAKLLDTYDVKEKTSCQIEFGTVDQISVDILKMYQPSLDSTLFQHCVSTGSVFRICVPINSNSVIAWSYVIILNKHFMRPSNP